MSSEVAVLLNCGSRSERAAGERGRLAGLLRDAGIRADLLCADRGADLSELARAASHGGYRAVIAAGGDGTVSAVASALVGTEKALGVLPLGTVNRFARRLGVPPRLEEAVCTLAGARTARVDVGEVNGRIFVNNSTLGVYPRIVRYREQLRRRHGMRKWLAFGWAALRMLGRATELHARVVTAGEARHVSTPFLFVGTGDLTLGALDLGRGQRPAPGQLGVCVATPTSPRGLATLAARAALGHEISADELTISTADEVLVETPGQERLHVTLDGELAVLRTPLLYRVRPRALVVLGG